MEVILTSTEQQQLIKQSQLKDLITNDYLTDINNDNFKHITKLFFDGDSEKTKMYNIGSNSFMTVADVYSFFVWNPIADIDIKIWDYVRDFISVGKAIWAIWIKDSKYILERIPAENHIYSEWKHKVFHYYTNINNWIREYYVLMQVFTIWEIENKLYKINSFNSTTGDIVPLDSISQTSWLQERYITGLEFNSLLIAQEDSVFWSNQSFIDRIKWIGYSLDRKEVLFDIQFLQDVEQYKIFDNIDLARYSTGERHIDFNSVWKVHTNIHWENGNIRFVSNDNPLIAQAIEYQKYQVRKLSSVTFIPLDFLSENTTWTTSWSSRTIMVNSFIRKIEQLRGIFWDTIIHPFLLLLESNRQREKWELITSSFFWDDVLARDSKELAEELKVARETWIISQFSAVKNYMGYHTDSDVEQELLLINNSSNELTWSQNQSSSVISEQMI